MTNLINRWKFRKDFVNKMILVTKLKIKLIKNICGINIFIRELELWYNYINNKNNKLIKYLIFKNLLDW